MESYDLDQHEEDLTVLLHAWPDIEEALLAEAAADEGRSYSTRDARALVDALREAFRVEVQTTEGAFGVAGLGYVLLFDVNSYSARQAAALLGEYSHGLTLRGLVSKHAPL